MTTTPQRTHPPAPIPHSPLPWQQPYHGRLELRDATGRAVMLALVERDACSRKQAEADLEFVRRAVNEYEELRADLEQSADVLARHMAGIRHQEYEQPRPEGERPFVWRLGCALTLVSVRLLEAEQENRRYRDASQRLTLDAGQRERLAEWVRFYGGMSERMYADRPGFSTPGSDRVDAERHRLVAAALRLVMGGSPALEAASWFRAEWRKFQAAQNEKVKAAPVIPRGATAGLSWIDHTAATDSMGEAGERDILGACEHAIMLAGGERARRAVAGG